MLLGLRISLGSVLTLNNHSKFELSKVPVSKQKIQQMLLFHLLCQTIQLLPSHCRNRELGVFQAGWASRFPSFVQEKGSGKLF